MYCTNCGAEISDRAVVCVKCGCTPAGNGNYCSNCGVEAAKSAVACIKCGCALYGSQSPVANGEKSNRWLTSFLLCVFLGPLGIHNFYAGNKTEGIFQLVITLLVMFVGFLPVLLLGAFITTVLTFVLGPFAFITSFLPTLPVLLIYIWPLIDLINILRGTFPDGKNGGYVTR